MSQAKAAGQAQKHTVLVVEDDESIRETMRAFLEDEGYQIWTASDGKAALEILSTRERPCLIFGRGTHRRRQDPWGD